MHDLFLKNIDNITSKNMLKIMIMQERICG